MKFHFNITPLKQRRQKLRKDSTYSEKVLWNNIRNNKLGQKFLRQYSVDGYVTDFYCPKKRLALEIDGEYHTENEALIYDKYRSRYLEAFNIKIVRFTNDEIETKLKDVLRKISVLLLD